MPVNWIPLLVPEADYLELAAIVASRTRERGEEPAFLPVVAAPSSEEGANTSTALSYANAGVAELVAWSIEDLRRFLGKAPQNDDMCLVCFGRLKK